MFRSAQDRISRQTAQLVESTRRDPLTGMLNHGALVAELAEALERARARHAPIGVGAHRPRQLPPAQRHPRPRGRRRRAAPSPGCRGAHRPPETIVGRYGPDEFLLIAPSAAIAELEPTVDRLRDALADDSLQFDSVGAPADHDQCRDRKLPEHGRVGHRAAVDRGARRCEEAKASGGDAVRVAGRPCHEARRTPARSASSRAWCSRSTPRTATQSATRRTSRRYGVVPRRSSGWTPDLVETVRVAGLLHDVGKVGIPDAILRKPGAAHGDEMDVVKQHVALGDMIVRDLDRIDVVRLGIRHHHERWDGRGYLDGLAGEEIPLVARILAVGDAFSAMTTTRPYRKAL